MNIEKHPDDIPVQSLQNYIDYLLYNVILYLFISGINKMECFHLPDYERLRVFIS